VSPIVDEQDLRQLMVPEEDQPEYLICKVKHFSSLRSWDVQFLTINVYLEFNG
jgi:hypothetical protein